MGKSERRKIERIRIYQERNRVLHRLGFDDYTEYLRSELWASIRDHLLAEVPACVGGCGRAATQVHHGQYRLCDLTGITTDELYPVCGGCHLSIEFKRGEKLTTPEATNRLMMKARVNARLRVSPRPKRRQGKRKRCHQPPVNPKEAKAALDDLKRRKKLWVHPRNR